MVALGNWQTLSEFARCPLYHQKRTLLERSRMSALRKADTITTLPISLHFPIAFLLWSHSRQKIGQVIPPVTLPAALAAFQSAAQDRSRAYSSARHSSIQTLSVILAASLKALLTCHSTPHIAEASLSQV
jgi:hypothetical protein